MSGTNIVPMPNMMPAMWSGNPMPAGCCPPGGMTDLMKCYCDIQAATAFISKVVTDLAANDPAFQKALVDGIVASGSNIPLIGVTNGQTASAGQVGEYFEVAAGFAFAAGATTTQTLTLGVLQPGDWDCWMWATFASPSSPNGVAIQGASFYLTPPPAGLAVDLSAVIYSSGAPEGIILSSMASQLITAVPVLIAASATVTALAATPGTMTVYFAARRRR